MEKIQKRIRRELKVWVRLKHSTIVPLLGTAQVESSSLALVSQWMPSGTLCEYLEKQGTIIPPSARVGLAKGIAEGLDYLHTKDVIHGDLHPGNVLIDDSGNPCLADFGLATVAGDEELQLTTLTAESILNSRWRAPEVIGIDGSPERPTFKSDIYSFGSVMFFIISGDIPWKEKKQSHQICIELSKRLTPARPDNIFDNHWNLIQKCWSWDPMHRPGSADVFKDIISRGTAARTRETPQDYRSQSGNAVPHGECEQGKPSAYRQTTSIIQGSSDTPGPLVMMSVDPKQEYRGPPRNVVLYGECGMGKTSLITLITSRGIAKTSPDGFTCTTTITPQYDVTIKGQCFRLWDTTAGLNERSRGVVPAAVVERTLTAFLRGLNKKDGVHLLIYCVRGTRTIGAPQTNYKTFSSVIGDSKVPTVIVATCVEDFRPVMAQWWDKNKDHLSEDGVHFSGYACVTTLSGGPADSPDVRRCHAQSYEDVCGLILDYCSDTPHKIWGADIKDQRNFVQKLACLP
ncbi:kinase-like protein [Rhizopogon vinicolor AM-OR11-026]|uniref:Kinase-like protein n=1 Tax=Rhizopogon vinicolor AM-OR11-026 TaxID=1314800 RepID=A0A1B7MQ44_9AGAM|nr:kinase-like protein [Rhizopogon vinicolor AM-OR11-026]